MQKIKFVYDEPMIGELETEGDILDLEEIIKEIEEQFPEAINIEIIETEEID